MDNLPVGTVLIWRKSGAKFVITGREKYKEIEWVTLFGIFPGDSENSEQDFTLQSLRELINAGTLRVQTN